METLHDADWEHAWRRQAEPREFGAGLWVVPTDAPRPPDARAVVRLDPGLAFGTGAHPTTALCLAWLAACAPVGRTVIDYGCGSGILAVAAAVLGASTVYAWDHDPQALDATRANADVNGVGARLRIAADPPPAVRPGGSIALSGILPEQAPALAARYAGDFDMHPPRERDGWVLLAGTRRGAAARDR